MIEVIDALARVNLVAALTIAAVLAVRMPVRRRLGPEVAYRLWVAPPLAAAATVTPLKVAHTHVAAAPHLLPAAAAPALLAAWAVGVLLAVALMWRAQRAFLQAARAGRAGPAVVGVITPRLIMPPDDGRYSEEERKLIRAHEREHMLRKDPRAGALMAAFQCLAWFNPLVHLAIHLARLDQELACDAAVVRRHPQSRALYARTLLKTQLAGAALPLGCYWPARSRHPLEVRVELLRRPATDAGLQGFLLISAGVVAAAILAWSVEPPLSPAPLPDLAPPNGIDASPMSVMLVTWRVPAASHR